MMWRNGRRVVAHAWGHARLAYAALVAENDSLRADLRNARAARDQAIDLVRELQAAIMERNKADGDLHHLRRERDIVRAQAVEHDPTRPLH